MRGSNFGVPQALIDKFAEIESAKEQVLSEISKAAMANLGVKSGDVMRHKYNGLLYKVAGFSTYMHSGRVRINVQASRYYQTGRRAGMTARSNSFVSFEDLEKPEGADV